MVLGYFLTDYPSVVLSITLIYQRLQRFTTRVILHDKSEFHHKEESYNHLVITRFLRDT